MPTPELDLVTEARELAGWAILAMPPSPCWPEKATADGAKRVDDLVASLADEVEQLRKYNADLVAANLSNLLGEIKERLTPEEGEQFQALLMSATKGWVDEVTERSAVDRGLLTAFKDLPERKKKR